MAELNIVIHLIHGEPIKLRGQRSHEEIMNLGAGIERAMDAKYLCIELDGKVMMIPEHNIKWVEVSPAPDLPIKWMIRNVERVK
jgi:hypothetical protein